MLNYIHVPATEKESSETPKKKIDTLFADMQDKKIKDIVVYIHGGINTYNYARKQADNITAHLKSEERHCITIVWETGPVETLRSQLQTLMKRPLLQKISSYLNKRFAQSFPEKKGTPGTLSWGRRSQVDPDDVLAKVLTAEDATTLDEVTSAALITQLANDFKDEIDGDYELIAEIAKEIADADIALTDEFMADVKTTARAGTLGAFDNLDLPNFMGRIGVRVAERIEKRRDHGRWATIVEEVFRSIYLADIVKASWDDMKKRAADMWQEKDGDTFESAYYFLHKLQEYTENNPDTRINLMAHSAGSISVCHLLATAAKKFPKISFGHVIFTAPAASLKLVYDEVITKTDRFKEFTLFTLSDEQELADAILPHIYPSSLLYLVSGILEEDVDEPLSGMMRYQTGEEPFRSGIFAETRNFIQEKGKERLILAQQPATPAGLQVKATRHGDFDKDRAMLESIKKLLDQG